MQKMLLILLLAALTACGSEESSEHYLLLAKDYMAKSENKAATIELKNALKLDGTSAEARWLLGSIYLETGDVQSAEKELQGAQNLGWREDDVSPALAQALLSQGKFQAVLDLDYKLLNPGAAAELLSRQALATLVQGNLEDAGQLVGLAIQKDPQSVDAKIAEAHLLAARGDAANSLIVLEEVLAVTPENADAWRLKGNLLTQRQELEKARAAFDQAIEHSPITYDDRVKRALLNLQLNDLDAAEADSRKLIEMAPRHPASNYVQGLIYFQRQEHENAINALTIAEPLATQYPLTLFYLASAHLMANNLDQAKLFASRFVNLSPNNIDGRKLLAGLYLKLRNFENAQGIIQPVLDNNPDDVAALNIMASALLGSGDTGEGLNLLARVAALQPGIPEAQMRLGAGLMLSGKVYEASQHLEAALDIDPEFQQADVLLVLNHLQKSDYSGAIESAKAYQRRNIGKAAPYNVLGQAYQAAGKESEARDAWHQALRFKPGDPSANQSLAQQAMATNDIETARQYYQTILQYNPDNLRTLLQLAALEARSQNEEAMVTRLKYAIDKHPKALDPRLMLARYYLGSGRADQVSPLFGDLEDLQRQSRPVVELTAIARLADNDYATAQSSLEQLIITNPNSAHYHYLLAITASGAGDKKKAQRELQEAYQLDENHIPTRVALARLALADQHIEDFSQHLAMLDTLAPNDPDVLRLRALAALRKGSIDDAIEYASLAHKINPSTQTLLELADYLKRDGQSDGAHRLIRKWITEYPENVTARLALANDLQRENDIEAAHAQYLTIIELDPDNIIALNNVAWNIRLTAPKQALEYIRRAAKSAPDRPEVLDTLAVIEYLNGENRLAYRNIERALARASHNTSIRYHKAMIGAALGERDEAITILTELRIQDAANFPEKTEAEALLKSLRGNAP